MGPKLRQKAPPPPPPPPPAVGAAVAFPVTPVKARRLDSDPGRQHVEKLNQVYNLGVPLAEQPLSPADKDRMARVDAHFRRHNSITNLLRIHHYKDPYRLQAVLDDFDAQARERSSNWVHKSRTARGLIPSPRATSPPQAQRMDDQVEMQELLLSLLEASRSAMVQQTNSGGGGGGSSQQSKAGGLSMAAVNAGNQTPPLFHDATLNADIDRVPVITRIGQAIVRERQQQTQEAALEKRVLQGLESGDSRPRSSSVSSSGSSTASSAMYSALDSFEEQTYPSHTTVDADDTDSANETEEFPDEEWYRSMPLRRPASQESFAVSDGMLEAFEESFGLFDNVASPAGVQRSETRDSTDTTDSGLLDMEALRLADAGDAPGESESGPPEPVPGLWDRLTNIFRMSHSVVVYQISLTEIPPRKYTDLSSTDTNVAQESPVPYHLGDDANC